jgi:hypothetical protein
VVLLWYNLYMADPRYGFLDESPSLPDLDHFFVVVLVVAASEQLTSLRRLLKQVRTRTLGKQLRDIPELKFYHAHERVRRKVLELLARQPVQVAIYVVDKQGRSVDDTPINYGLIVGKAVAAYLTEIHPHLSLIVDKKYTAPSDRARFNQVVERVVATDVPTGRLASTIHAESYHESLIQLADFVVGAAHQKYNRGNAVYLDILQQQIVLERTVRWAELKATASDGMGV